MQNFRRKQKEEGNDPGNSMALADRTGTRKAFFGTFFFLFIGGYLFFFTSNFWMPQAGDARRLTELNRETDWNRRKVSILRWDYSEGQELMEVELSITSRQFDGVNAYRFSALESGGQNLKVRTVVEEPDWVILQIEAVPKRFQEISLRMEMDGDEGAGTLKMYTNANDVNRVASIETKDRTGYLVSRYESEEAAYETLIQELSGKIEEEKESIQAIQEEIDRMERQKGYETQEEAEQTDRLIADANGDIDSAQSRIEEYQAQAGEYKERIQNLEEQIRKLGEGME